MLKELCRIALWSSYEVLGDSMKDRLGTTISVGSKVVFLRTPVKTDHEFIEGTVVKLNSKKVAVHFPEEDYTWSGGITQKIYNRYPEQVFVVGT